MALQASKFWIAQKVKIYFWSFSSAKSSLHPSSAPTSTPSTLVFFSIFTDLITLKISLWPPDPLSFAT